MAEEDHLEIVEGKVLGLDGEAFLGKHLLRCVLVYKGGTPPIMRNSTFEECTFRFEGPARNTLDFLSGIATNGGGGAELVAALVGLASPKGNRE